MNHKQLIQLEIAKLTNSIFKYNRTCKDESEKLNFVLITLEQNTAEGVIEADITRWFTLHASCHYYGHGASCNAISRSL